MGTNYLDEALALGTGEDQRVSVIWKVGERYFEYTLAFAAGETGRLRKLEAFLGSIVEKYVCSMDESDEDLKL